MEYIAVDIGASSGKMLKGNLRGKRLATEVVHRFKNTLEERNGHLCWSLDSLFGSILEGLGKSGDASFVSIDTWGVDFVLLDKQGRLVTDSTSYRDKRTKGISCPVSQEELYARTGIQKQEFNTIYQLLAIKNEEPEALMKADRLLFIPDYLNYLLTGIMRQEYTIASTSNLLDAQKKDWDRDLIGRLGIKEDLFLPVSMPGEVLGPLKEDIMRQTGCRASVVLAPGHDTACAVIGAPLDDRSLFLSSGTWSLVGALEEAPVLNARAQEENLTNEGGAYGDIRLLKNIMGTWMIQCLGRECGKSFDEMEKAARETDPPGLVDPGDARFLSPSSMTEEIGHALEESGYRTCRDWEECAAVVYHSLAKAYADAASAIENATGRTFDHIAIVGGGSKDGYLNLLTAMHTRKKISAGPAEGTAVGNLLFSMAATGTMETREKNEVLRNSADITYIRRTDI